MLKNNCKLPHWRAESGISILKIHLVEPYYKITLVCMRSLIKYIWHVSTHLKHVHDCIIQKLSSGCHTYKASSFLWRFYFLFFFSLDLKCTCFRHISVTKTVWWGISCNPNNVLITSSGKKENAESNNTNPFFFLNDWR